MRERVKNLIDSQIPDFYRRWLGNICPSFPVDPLFLILRTSNCRARSYRKLAQLKGVTVQDVAEAFGSQDGCTHYKRKTGKYLISYNDIGKPPARVRWTLAHELGHIFCGHFLEIEGCGLSEVPDELMKEMEEEADYFAASLLAPFPAIRKTKAKSAEDVRNYFGLSVSAANYRWTEYRNFSGPHPLDDFFRCQRITLRWKFQQASKSYWRMQREMQNTGSDY